jgi:hypothetical protein
VRISVTLQFNLRGVQAYVTTVFWQQKKHRPKGAVPKARAGVSEGGTFWL